MVPVPSYQLIPFLAWLYEHRIRITPQDLDQNQLRELAYDFLRSDHALGATNLRRDIFDALI
jgi:hypothetical protein